MPTYQVILRGENFPISLEEGTQLMGFFTTRCVRAKGAEEAEQKAVDLIRRDRSLTSVLDRNSNIEPRVYLEELSRIPWWRSLGGKGYTFYPMEKP